MQLIITSHLLAVKRKAATVELNDLQRAYSLFLDQKRSVEFLERNEREFISGNEWEDGGREDGGREVNGSDEAAHMQEIEA